MRLGYACINLSLPKTVTTNRSMTSKTLGIKGTDYVSELALKNAKDILPILKWNVENGITFFRMSSAIIPWGDRLDITQLKDYKLIVEALQTAGQYATDNNIRITTHPGPFVVLVSPKPNVVESAIKDLEMHGLIFDLMGLSRTPYNKINIHCNGVYGDKKSAMDRFCQNFERLSDSVKSRLTIENDDKSSMYSISDLMYIHNKIAIPLVFDFHHHRFCDGGLSEYEALTLATSTWKNGITPVVHYSESKIGGKPQAHSDYIESLPNLYGFDVDVIVEAKMKNLALSKFIK